LIFFFSSSLIYFFQVSNSNLPSFPGVLLFKGLGVFPVDDPVALVAATLSFPEVETSEVLLIPDVRLLGPVAKDEGLLGVAGCSDVDKAANALLARLSAKDVFEKPLEDMILKFQKFNGF
jgi:hypothetical protein